MTARRILLAALAAGLAASAVAAQEAELPQATFFAPLEVPLVSVEVYVSGRDGRPMPGLTVEDFEIFEDGRPVEISHFYASGGAAQDDAESVPEAAFEEAGSAPGQDLYLVIYFDDTNLNRGRRQAAIEHLRTFLASELPPDLKIMLVRYDGRIHVEQPFTEETDEVAAALESVREAASLSRQIDETMLLREIENAMSMAAVSGDDALLILEQSGRSTWQSIGSYVDQTVHRTRTSIENQKRLVRSLSGLSGRKALILVTDGVEARPGEMLYRTWSQVFGQVPEFRIDAQRAFTQASRNDLTREFAELAQFANGHRVSFYTLSTLGAGSGFARSAESKFMDEGGLAVDQALSAEVLLANMAGVTGGRYLVNSPGLSEQLDEVSTELASYYSLAFEPHHVGDGTYHRLEVKVHRDGVKVRHREGYRDVPLDERITDRTLAAAVHGVADNPLGISVAVNGEIAARDDGSFVVPVIITVPIGQLVLIPAENEHQGRVSISLTVRDRQGGLSPPSRREFPLAIPNASLAAALSQTAGFTMQLAVRSGRQRIAVGLRDEVARTDSVTFLETDVGNDATGRAAQGR
ncbi:MAG TPA: VWA domain-containing protein [Chondromyces sp.]|nr:VWA domain-containing protein [Chondromyces sp.]